MVFRPLPNLVYHFSYCLDSKLQTPSCQVEIVNFVAIFFFLQNPFSTLTTEKGDDAKHPTPTIYSRSLSKLCHISYNSAIFQHLPCLRQLRSCLKACFTLLDSHICIPVCQPSLSGRLPFFAFFSFCIILRCSSRRSCTSRRISSHFSSTRKAVFTSSPVNSCRT